MKPKNKIIYEPSINDIYFLQWSKKKPKLTKLTKNFYYL